MTTDQSWGKYGRTRFIAPQEYFFYGIQEHHAGMIQILEYAILAQTFLYEFILNCLIWEPCNSEKDGTVSN
jgi:hypothetical protein